MTVEHLLGIPERVPVRRGAGLLAGDLLGVAAAGGEQRDILGPPALVEQPLDVVVTDVECVVERAGHEPHFRTVAAEETHRVVDEGLEGGGDLPGVADVLVEDQRHQRHRRGALAVEHPLALVDEHVQPAALGIAQRGQHRLPPAVGEVLRLVDDDRVEPLPVGQFGGELEHGGGQIVLEEPRRLLGALVLVGTLRGAPLHAETVELADVPGLLSARPLGGDTPQVGGQAVGVADQRHPLALVGQPAGLLDGEEGLAAAGAAPDLHPVEQLHGGEDDGLLLVEDVGGVLVVLGTGHHIALRKAASVQSDAELLDGGVGEQRQVSLLIQCDIAQQRSDVADLVTVDDHPPWAVRQREVLRDRAFRENNDVIPPHPSLGPAGVALDELSQRITRLTYLPHWMNGFDLAVVLTLLPLGAVVPDLAAFDFDADDADAMKSDDEVDLVILAPVGDPLAGDDDVVFAELFNESFEDLPFSRGGQSDLIGKRDGHWLTPPPVYPLVPPAAPVMVTIPFSGYVYSGLQRRAHRERP